MLYEEKNRKMSIKRVKIKFRKKNIRFFLISQGSFNPKIRFLGQKVCPVARPQTGNPQTIRLGVEAEFDITLRLKFMEVFVPFCF